MSDSAIASTPFPASSASFWQRKLDAYRHDSPSKPLDIRTHEERAENARVRAEIPGHVQFDKTADHTAAAADRLPFPSYRASGLSCDFDGVRNKFRHPLGGFDGKSTFPVSKPFATVAQAEETEQVTQPVRIHCPDDWDDTQKARAGFFAHWRLWSEHAARRDARFALLPADTRIPDHTIWSHLAITSAFEGCDGSPAFLRFHLGPVQDFIAAARSTRDLWSGSFLISWLMMAGLKRLSKLAGPDATVFPSLHGQPLFDLHWRNDLWRDTRAADGAVSHWDSFQHQHAALTTPNLPNVFLALVPADQAADIAQEVKTAMTAEWEKIAASVWDFAIKPGSPAAARRARFDRQVSRHLSISWQITPFPASVDAAWELAARSLPDKSLLERFDAFRRIFEKDMPRDHRDGRFYIGGKDGPKEKLNNIGNAWPLLVALNAWWLDAVRQTRGFPGVPGGWDIETSSHNAKDALTGREEMITGGSKDIFDGDLSAQARGAFRHNDEVGAITLIKRLWHLAWLCKNEDWRDVFKPSHFAMPNTRSLAQSRPWATDADEKVDDARDDDRDGKYFAILALDGDDMGKWVSGEKAPPLGGQLADYTDTGAASGKRKGALEYFERTLTSEQSKNFANTPRLLTPSYHLQFSQALSNFALHAVPRIIAAHDGRLLYAGGDDVLAMLPATKALNCADDLQRAFRGLAPSLDCGIRAEHPGFLTFERWEKQHNTNDASPAAPLVFARIADDAGNPIPHLVPGLRATASCGIAIAHFKSPLQDVVRAAQTAQKRAKQLHDDKHAFAISLFKRSGEIIEWAARFDLDDKHDDPKSCQIRRHAKPALGWILHAINAEILSSKFPHKLLELVSPYRSAHGITDLPTPFDIREALLRDLDLAMDRQRGKNWPGSGDEIRRIRESLATCLRHLPGDTTQILDALNGLLTAAAFLARQ